MIDIRLYWDGELAPFADVVVDHPEQIPKVGDTIWLQWWKQSGADAIPNYEAGTYPPIEPLTVLQRGHHLWVRQGEREPTIDPDRMTESDDADIRANLEIALFVARVNKSKETP